MTVRGLPVAVVRRAAGPVLYRLARLAGGTPPGLRRGADVSPADVPVVVVLVEAATAEAVASLLEHVTRAQALHDDFTAVFVVDVPVLAPFRRAGYVVELAGPPGVGAAVAEARRSYDAGTVVVVDASSGTAGARLGELLAELGPPPPGGLVQRARRVLRRVESRWG